MGGFLSSLYADVKCAFDENKMLNAKNTDNTIIYAIRIIDDLFGWIAYDKTTKRSLKKAEKLKQRIFKNTYKGGLTLTDEQDRTLHENKYYINEFIGAIIVTNRDGKEIYCKAKNPNI